MKPGAALMLLAAGLVFAEDSVVPVTLRGKRVTLTRLQTLGAPAAAVMFLSGDGGWRGAAVSMCRTIASWGYDVYAFDTKKYLESFSEAGSRLSLGEMASDLRMLASRVAGISNRRVILAGWSQGAGMAVAAASGAVERGEPIQGILTLGLPESAVLGWDWKATLAVIARREPDLPSFEVKPLLPGVAPAPLWMIHGTEDEYTARVAARRLFETAGEPKRLEEIQGANHRFDGHTDEMYQSVRKGLKWVASR